MEDNLNDYIGGKTPSEATQINDNFIAVLAYNKALYEVLGLTEEQISRIESLQKIYYNHAIQKADAIRRGEQ